MATAQATPRRWFRKAEEPRRRRLGLRVLTAASTRLDLEDRREARRMRALRQGWQLEAWAYRDSIGELRYAVNFLANCAARMKIFPAAYPQGGEADNPVPLADLGDCPPEIVAACGQAMTDLGNGRLAMAPLLHSLSTNLTVAGECFILGQEDGQTGAQTWAIRSVDELLIYDDAYKLREVPMDPQGILGWIDLDPNLTVGSRMWAPHPRFRILADSPLRAVMDDMESLLILRRGIRATGRSRLAVASALLIPNELSLAVPLDDDADPEADPFMAQLTEAMVEPIADEGVASAVVPILMRGPAEMLDKVRILQFARDFDELSMNTRAELVGIIATGLDLPKEIIIGVADLNHWTAWQVDDNTFRHHVEPHVITAVDCLTGGYLRPYLENCDVDPTLLDQWVERCLMWYDPGELVTHPDQTSDALQLHDRLVISDAALLRVAGFGENDAPAPDEYMARLISKQRTWPPNLTMGIIHDIDPTLVVPPMSGPPALPGIKPGGVDVGQDPSAVAVPAPAAIGAPPAPLAPLAPPAKPGPPEPAAPALAASAASQAKAQRLSRKLSALDADLRARLQTAANAAMMRQLEKAGGRLRSKVAKDETMRTAIAHTRMERVGAVLGQSVVAALGLTATELLNGDWADLKAQFYAWTAAAQRQAIATAQQLAGIADDSEAVGIAERSMAHGLDAGWERLSNAMTELSHHLLYNPDPNAPEEAAFNPDTLVPAGTIRASLVTAGGGQVDAIGQVGTGSVISDMLSSAGADTEGYEWTHGPSLKPFEPHEALDGVQFSSFDDPALANSGSWPDNEYYLPGDHDGCLCDATPLWVTPGEAAEG